jgi:hypothetical protein
MTSDREDTVVVDDVANTGQPMAKELEVKEVEDAPESSEEKADIESRSVVSRSKEQVTGQEAPSPIKSVADPEVKSGVLKGADKESVLDEEEAEAPEVRSEEFGAPAVEEVRSEVKSDDTEVKMLTAEVKSEESETPTEGQVEVNAADVTEEPEVKEAEEVAPENREVEVKGEVEGETRSATVTGDPDTEELHAKIRALVDDFLAKRARV